MRAGIRFDVLQGAARKESMKQYVCLPLWARAQRCTIVIDPGTLTAILDSTGQVMRIVTSPDAALRYSGNVHGVLVFRDVVRDTRAAWDSAGTLHRDLTDGNAPELRWVDRGGRWGASLWYTRDHRANVPPSSAAALDAELAMTLPESIGVTDLPAYALFVQRRPPPPADTAPVRHTRPAAQVPPTADDILTMLRSDLRALTIAQEGVVHGTGAYATSLDSLGLRHSPGVRVELLWPTPDGWSAVATHPLLPGVSCVVFAGNVAAPPATWKQGRRAGPGEIACDQP